MVVPAILEKDWGEIEKKIELCRNFTRNVHVDFIDGKFSANSTFLDFDKFKKFSSYFNLEAHLMVEEPINYLERLFDAGFKTYLGQVEKMSDQVEFVAKGQELGEVGLCLDLPTPISKINIPFEDLDRVLLLSVPAGNSGQSFSNEITSKIKNLREKTLVKIEIDGGIDDKTIKIAKENGGDIFCANSFLFDHSPADKYHLLSSLVSA